MRAKKPPVVSAAYDRALRAAVSRALRGQGFAPTRKVDDRFTWFRRDAEATLLIEIVETARHRWSFSKEEKRMRRTPLRVEAAVAFDFLPAWETYSSSSRPDRGGVPDLRDAHYQRLARPERGVEWSRSHALIPRIAEAVRSDLLPWLLRMSKAEEAFADTVASLQSDDSNGKRPAESRYRRAEILAGKLGLPTEEWARKAGESRAAEQREFYDND